MTDENYCYVTENLLLGNSWSITDQVLQKENIRSVLSVGSYGDIRVQIDKRKIIRIDDNEHEKDKLLEILPECFDFINEELAKGNKVLIHCNGGVSRSASVVIGYLMVTQGMLYDEAFAFVKSKRSVINPNKGFQTILKIGLVPRQDSVPTTELLPHLRCCSLRKQL